MSTYPSTFPATGPATWDPTARPLYDGGGDVIHAPAFDGTNDYGMFTGALNGVSDGKLWTASLGVKFNGGNGIVQVLTGNTQFRFQIAKLADNRIQVLGRDFPAATQMRGTTTSAFTDADGWIHLAFSGNQAVPGSQRIKVNGVTDGSFSIFNDAILHFERADWGIAAAQDGTSKSNCCIAELYMNFGEYVDWDVPAEMEKVFKDGKIQHIGGDGSSITSNSPRGGYWANPPATFLNDRSIYNNNFTLIGGPLVACSTSP